MDAIQFTLLNEKHPKGYMWSGRRHTKIQATLRPDYVWPEIWPDMSKAAQKKEKRGIYFIDPEAGEYKETTKKRWKKLEIPMEPTMPCNMGAKQRSNRLQETASEKERLQQNPQDKACMNRGGS